MCRYKHVVLFSLAFGSILRAAEPALTVKLASGREFTAQVDQRTGDQLWLRFSAGRASILRPIDWDRVKSAQLDGKEVELTKLRELYLMQTKATEQGITRLKQAIPDLKVNTTDVKGNRN